MSQTFVVRLPALPPDYNCGRLPGRVGCAQLLVQANWAGREPSKDRLVGVMGANRVIVVVL